MAPMGKLGLSTAIKSALAIAVALTLGWAPALRLLATTSAEAVVNARIITLRAPIEGDVTMAIAATGIGSKFESSQEILTIRNPRADYSHLDNLRREREQLGTTLAALEAKRDLLTANVAELSAQQENFRAGRIAQLEQRILETEADIAATEARHELAAAALSRASTLKKTDAVSQAFLDKALQDERVTKNTIRSLTERRKGTLVELDAAKKGIYIGDSYNDTPQSAQRKMEASLELADVRARLAGSKAELAVLQSRIDAEVRRNEELSSATIRSTVDGRVWEILTAPGEHVNAGQDLVRLLDCGSAMVTASVSETAYQKLRIGQSATFRPRDGGKALSGRIVGLNGLAAVSSNSAIQQSVLAREPYHVTLNFPGLAVGGDCQVGRSGLVEFNTSSLASSAHAN
jgi:multidrug resistance efflux pump